jgi:hypothetical protein
MRISPAWRKIIPMSFSEANSPPPMMSNRMLYTLELESSADPICGRLRGNDGTDHSFSGWLGLAAVLQSALDREHIEGER